jgi:hypothetical protein
MKRKSALLVIDTKLCQYFFKNQFSNEKKNLGCGKIFEKCGDNSTADLVINSKGI